jgi:amino acid permease
MLSFLSALFFSYLSYKSPVCTKENQDAAIWAMLAFFPSMFFSWASLYSLNNMYIKYKNRERPTKIPRTVEYKWVILAVLASSLVTYGFSAGKIPLPFVVKIEKNQ